MALAHVLTTNSGIGDAKMRESEVSDWVRQTVLLP
jgi:hypothetical protein